MNSARAIDVFDWQVPPECPGPVEARQRVEGWLAKSLAPVDPRSLRIVAKVEAEDGGFRLSMSMETSLGRSDESLFATHCETLIDVIGLRAALAADPARVIDEQATPPPSSPAVAPTPQQPQDKPLLYQLRLTGDALLGLVPTAAPGLSLFGAVEVARVRVELGARYVLPRELHYGLPEGVGAQVQTAAVSLRGCLGPHWKRVQLLTCLGLEGGAMRGEGFGVGVTRVSWQPWLVLSAGPGLRIPGDSRVALWLGVDALLQLLDVRFQVRHLPRLFESDRTAFRASGGLEVRL